MSRSGYSDDCEDNWQLICYRGAVKSAIRGRRGQAFLKEMLAALDALPVKRLAANELETVDLIPCSHWGLFEAESVCALGAVGKARGVDMTNLDPDDTETVAGTFGVSEALAREIVWMNDEYHYKTTPEQRYRTVREWVEGQIRKPALPAGKSGAPTENNS